MKLKNERIFTADIYETKNFKTNTLLETGEGVSFGNHYYDEKLVQKGAIVVKFGTSYYVPVYHIRSLFSYADVAQYVSGRTLYNDPKQRLLHSMPCFDGSGARFVKNVQPLFAEKGKTSLKSLLEMQAKRPPEITGGMDMY